MLKGTPRPKGMAARAPRGSVQDALEALEGRRRKRASKASPTKRRGDLDLDSIE